MKRSVLHHLAILSIAAGTFLYSASFAQANTFTLPQTFHYPGLSFSGPLTYTKPLSVPGASTTINFASSQHKLKINKDDTLKPLESIILTPTVTETTVADSTNDDAQPTPTTDSQPTPTVFASQDESVTPTDAPTDTVQPTGTPPPSYTPAPQSNVGGLNADDILSMVNSYRAAQGLPAFQQDAKTCSLAQERAPEVAGEVASGNMHAGLIAMNLPYWNTENIISMNSDQAAFNWWINDPIHHAAIVSNNTYSCIACSGNSCAEEFTSYQPK
jgi:uncharacterized protein YkwD